MFSCANKKALHFNHFNALQTVPYLKCVAMNLYELGREKTGLLHMGKQRRRSAVQ